MSGVNYGRSTNIILTVKIFQNGDRLSLYGRRRRFTDMSLEPSTPVDASCVCGNWRLDALEVCPSCCQGGLCTAMRALASRRVVQLKHRCPT